MKHLSIYVTFLFLLAGCAGMVDMDPCGTDILLDFGKAETKSSDPPEDLLSDLNILIFDSDGVLESARYFTPREIGKADGMPTVKTGILKGLRTTVVCCSNLGYRLEGIKDMEDMRAARFSMNYPDEYSKGIPCCGIFEGTVSPGEGNLTIRMERLMSRISVGVDRTALDDGIAFIVHGISVGNCPRTVSLLGPGKAEDRADIFSKGFVKKGTEVSAMNTGKSGGKSGETSLYVLENMQGDSSGGLCSYIEIEVEYIRGNLTTRPGEYLKYRFHIGESPGNHDVRRNCHYHYTIRPEGSGLEASGWKLDKGALVES